MTVYVDDMRMPARVGRVTARWSHLTADTKAELHAFATRLGLRRAWFQDDTRPSAPPGSWHYDVTDSVRRRALASGAQPVAWRDFAAVWQRPGREGREHLDDRTDRAPDGPAAPGGETPVTSSRVRDHDYRKLTQAELVADARARFGDDPLAWAFTCPACGDVAIAGDFPNDLRQRVGQECVGRHRGALVGPPDPTGRGTADRGCDWTAVGLVRGPWEIVMPDGHSAWGFPLAPATAPAATAAGRG